MNVRRFFLAALVGAATSLPQTAMSAPEAPSCPEALSVTTPQTVAHITSRQTEEKLLQKGFGRREARGYAILVGTMVGSAAATTYLTSALPENFHFLSQLLSQISTIGIYVFGAPIWEPLSSAFRKLAFGVRGNGQGAGDEAEAPGTADPSLEALWQRTQENYSLNAQMSRNTVTQFIISVQQNFYEAHRAATQSNPDYAADQIAEAAFRLRTLFKDIPPEEASIAQVVRSAFTNHNPVDANFLAKIHSRLSQLDPSYASSNRQDQYQKILRSWLGP